MKIKAGLLVTFVVSATALLAIAPDPLVAQPAAQQAIADELERLTGTPSPNKAEEVNPVPATIEVLPLEIGKTFEKTTEKFDKKIESFKIRNNVFYVDNKPRFLIGVESSGYDGPWLLDALGVDIQPIHNTLQANHRSALKVTKITSPDGKVHLVCDSDTPDPYGDARVREILAGGTLTWMDWHLSMRSFSALSFRDYKFDPLFYTPHLAGWRKNTSHYLDVNMDNPEARQLYLNNIRWSQRYLRKYPLPWVELVNEVSYINPSPAGVKAFQDAMNRKFGSISKANTAWRTSFKDFASVMPPLNIHSAMIANDPAHMIPSGKEFKNGLWVDWIKFSQRRSQDVFKMLADDYKAHDPKANVTFQSPYWQGTHAQSPPMYKKIVDLYGHEASLRLIDVKAGKEKWSDIRAMLGMSFSFDLISRALPDKPIMNSECGVWAYPKGEYIVGPAGVRSFFWNQAIHGGSGSVLSYYYSPSNSAGGQSTFDPKLMSLDAMKEMPLVGNEINSVAEIVLARPRPKGKVAVVYSYETGRMLPLLDKSRRGADYVADVVDIYGPVLFSGVALDVIDNDMLLGEDLRPYKVIFLARAIRVKPGTIDKLNKYVTAGGTLVVSAESLMIDDKTHKPIDPAGLLGGKVGPAVTKKEIVNFSIADLPSRMTETVITTPLDGVDDFSGLFRGRSFTPTTATVLATTTSGAPAMTVNKIGRGKVYFVARQFDGATGNTLTQWIIAQAKVKADTEVELTDNLKTNYVESHILSNKRGNHLLYAMNWGGGPRQATLKVLKDLRGSQFFVRNLRTRENIAPNGSPEKLPWSADQLAEGIACELAMQDPQVFVIDDASRDELALADIPAAQKEILSWLWARTPESARKILIDAYYVTEGRIHGYKMPTAVKMMEDAGFSVEHMVGPLDNIQARTAEEIRDATLDEFQVLILSGNEGRESTFGGEENMKLIADYVSNGGGLLVAGIRNWHELKSSDLLAMFDMEIGASYFYDPESAIADEPLWFTASAIGDHPITEGVSTVHVMGARPIRGSGVAAVSSGSNSYTDHSFSGEARTDGPQAIVMAAQFGKGRVVAVGSDYLFRPSDLSKADNGKLLSNIINWLAGEAPASAPASVPAEQTTSPESQAQLAELMAGQLTPEIEAKLAELMQVMPLAEIEAKFSELMLEMTPAEIEAKLTELIQEAVAAKAEAPQAPAEATAPVETEAIEVDTSNYTVLEPVPASTSTEATAKLWTLEGADAADFAFGNLVSNFAYTGSRSIQATRTGYDQINWDCRILLNWKSAGYCTLPENPHLNFAYYTQYPCDAKMVVETTGPNPGKRFSLEPKKWTWVSVPISEFGKGPEAIGLPLTTILVKAGEAETEMEIYFDDISITQGPLAAPR